MICAISLSCPWHYAYRICSNYLLQCGLPGWADTFNFAVNPTDTSIVVINNTAAIGSTLLFCISFLHR